MGRPTPTNTFKGTLTNKHALFHPNVVSSYGTIQRCPSFADSLPDMAQMASSLILASTRQQTKE